MQPIKSAAVAERTPRRIAVVCGAGTLSGKEVVSLELAEELRRSGDHVTFVTSTWGTPAFRQQLETRGIAFRICRLGFISKSLTWDALRMTLHQLLFVPALYLQYTRFLLSERPQRVVHTNWHHALLLLPFLRQERDFYWLHEVLPATTTYKSVFRLLSRRIRTFVSVSSSTRDSLLRIQLSPDQLQVVHNGISDPIGPHDTPDAPRRFSIGIAGQVAPWKGHDQLLAAFALLLRKCPDATLHIFGRCENAFAQALKQRAEALRISDKITWHGFVADKHRIFPAVEVIVVPSMTPDPLPTVAIEAAFFGKPVVAFEVGGLVEIIAHNLTGLLVPPGDPVQLADALLGLMRDPILLRTMAGNARRHALNSFSAEAFGLQFRTILFGTDSRLNSESP